MLYHPQMDEQTERMNQKLEQYLRFFVDHRQKNWPEWLVSVEFAINNKAYLTTKISLFMENYERKMKMGIDLRRKGKIKKATKFIKRMRKMQEEVEVVLARAQEEIKKQADSERKEVEVQKIRDRIMLSIKDLVFKERLAKKLVDQYICPYTIDEIVSTKIV